MKTSLVLILTTLLLLPTLAFSGQIWTDGNGDGLPDPQPVGSVPVGTVVTVNIWIDSQSFVWTNMQVYIERDPTLSFVSGRYTIIVDPSSCPIDNFSNPHATGFCYFGIGFRHGLFWPATLRLRKDAPGPSCARPIIDVNNPYGTFSVLGSQTSYFLFQSASGSCWDSPSATEETTWGEVKALFR